MCKGGTESTIENIFRPWGSLFGGGQKLSGFDQSLMRF